MRGETSLTLLNRHNILTMKKTKYWNRFLNETVNYISNLLQKISSFHEHLHYLTRKMSRLDLSNEYFWQRRTWLFNSSAEKIPIKIQTATREINMKTENVVLADLIGNKTRRGYVNLMLFAVYRKKSMMITQKRRRTNNILSAFIYM